jgi:methionyl-tRNA formyltransferase
LTLHDRLAENGAALLLKTLSKPLTETPQNESDVTICGKLTREHGKADPKMMTAETIDRMVRALTPWPGVTWNENKLLETSLTESPDALSVPCAQGTILYIRTIQPSGKKPMSGQEYARGHSSNPL